jgi:hypothetical protein
VIVVAKKFLVDLDLSTNELQNAVIQNLPAASEPTGEKGLLYFDSTNNILKVYNGSLWQSLATGGSAVDTIVLNGDVTGSATAIGSTITVSTLIAANSVALGTDTTGNYVAGATASTYISITGTPGEGWTPVFAVDATDANTASKVVARDGSGNFSAGTITATLSGLAASATIANGVKTNSVALGTDTTGNYVGALTASTGVNITGGSGESVTNVISIGQPVATSDSPTFAALTISGDLAVNGSDITTSGAGTANLFNTNALTLNIGGAATTVGIGSASGTTTINNNLTVTGDLLVSGSVTTLNTATLFVEDNIFILNSGVTGAPSLNAGIEIERGDSTNVSLLWNETSDTWVVTNDGTNYGDVTRKYVATISSSASLSYPITHNFNTRDVVVNVYTNSSDYDTVEVDVYRNTVNQVTIGFAASPAVNYRVVITG